MINEKTLKTLEYLKILDRVESHASFSLGKEGVRALRPSPRLLDAEEALAQTTEACALLDARPSTHLGGAHDIRSAVRRAEVGSVLTPNELMDIGTTLGCSVRVRSAIVNAELEIPWLVSVAGRLAEDRELTRALEDTFSERGEILDSASPALRRIRSDMQIAQSRLMERLNSMVSSPDNRALLQEPIVTMRNGRYVIPVRQDSRSKIQGIIHDQSASGQTVFVEPLVVTEMNNRLKELQLAEAREVERILQELSARVARQATELRLTVDALGEIDIAFAKAKYAQATRAFAPALNDEGRLNLVQARHPLLFGDVVPLSLWLGSEFRVLIVTGPNTGGKTVALKTVGLLTLMAQTGLHIPAGQESEVAVFPEIYADIGDEQSIEQSLSTFSSHMRNIIDMLPKVGPKTLVLLDELGAGTDPAEGSALARAILMRLLEAGTRAVVTTHYSELKTFALENTGVENASVEFDVETLSPTYRLIIGLPGRSQALSIAKRLGMSQSILAAARQGLSTGTVRVEKLLGQIQAERQEIGKQFERARDLHLDARKIRDRLQTGLRTLEAERKRILDEAREESAETVRELRRRLREIETEAGSGVSRRVQRDLQEQVDDAQTTAAGRLGPISVQPGLVQPASSVLRPGVTVSVGSIGQQATVISVSGGEAEVQMGQFKMRVPVDDIEVLSKAEREPERMLQYESSRPAPPSEIDVRGWRADEALQELDQYLHDNFVHGQATVRIIHGKGTGALRKAIRETLGDNPLVKGFGSERPEGGGDGVTVVQLAT